jgi:hypothetical protein
VRTDDALIINLPKPSEMIEVCRSFSYKLNLENHGGKKYESADFFASRKIQCSVEDEKWVSQQIFEDCVAEVRGAAAAFIAELRRKKEPRPALTGTGLAREFERWKERTE